MAKFVGYLPEDIFFKIFLLLPVKSLLRCKSVCMAWLSIISNPNFVKSHLKRAIENPSPLIIEKPAWGNEGRTFIHSVPVGLQYFNFIVIPRLLNSSCRELSSCCNGIICLHNLFGEVIYLWNPSIRQCKKLPDPPPRGSMMFAIGFGYDSISNDYKVLRIDKIPEVYVYSTSADCWRLFQGPIPENIELYGQPETYVNGVLYFRNMNELISFDLHSEVFSTLPYPGIIRGKRSNVLDFNGSVAMVFETIGPLYDLWTLDQINGQSVWIKKFSIDPNFMQGVWLYRYLGAGQSYGHKTLYGFFIFHNVLNDNEKKETMYSKIAQEKVFATLNYTETLVSIDGFEQVE